MTLHTEVFFSILVFRPSLPLPSVSYPTSPISQSHTVIPKNISAAAAAAAFVDLFHYPVVAWTPARCWAAASVNLTSLTASAVRELGSGKML